MGYVKIKDRNYKKVEVTIISHLGVISKMIREDRVNGYIRDFILFNNLKGKPFAIKEIL